MRLGKTAKFNMIIAILLCMVFVFNFGITLATTDYKFNASSVNTVIDGENPIAKHDAYTHFASMDGSSAKYVYSKGTYNNQLSINYGFNKQYNYDIMVAFTATYKSTTHKANDFTLNFVNRDKWCIDMGTIHDWDIQNGALVEDSSKTYYTTGSTTHKLQGVMYYMDTLNGSGQLPIISSVTFHTEQKDSWQYEGDVLTISLTPYYVVSDKDNYDDSHQFKSTTISGFTKDVEAFNNWKAYMSTSGTVASSASYMIYNSYVDDARSLAYPYDNDVMTVGGDGKPVVDTTLKTQPIYPNTAYQYKEVKTTTQNETSGEFSTITSRTYDSITAGNRMNGGLGVYVIPDSKLITVNISFGYHWQNNGVAGTANSEMVTLKCSNQIKTIVNNNTNYHYYAAKISEPTYINVLDYIMLTAEGASDVINGDYSLILSDISVTVIDSVDKIKTDDRTDAEGNPINNVWSATGYTKNNYEIHNSTQNSPVLALVRDIASGSATYQADISITNNNSTPLSLTSFTVKADLWYGEYEGSIKKFNKTSMDENYLTDDSLVYDKSIWSCSRSIVTTTADDGSEINNNVFVFSLSNGKSIYIPSGYSLTIISGIKISNPNTQTSTEVGVVTEETNDFWCTLDVTSISGNTTNIDYTQTSVSGKLNDIQSKTLVSGIELIVEGYYGVINEDNPGKIYIRNNSRQVITNANLSNIRVYSLYTEADNTNTIDYTLFVPRDRITGANATASVTQYITTATSIKPGEVVLICQILSEEDAIIYDFDISITRESTEENSDVDLTYSEHDRCGFITNNSNNYYEFRLSSTTRLTSIFTKHGDFVEVEVSQNQYYYYYKGILCPNRSIKIFSDFGTNVEVEYIVHNPTKSPDDYMASNYSDWNLDDTTDKDWFDAMKKLYNVPSDEDRTNAEMITAPNLD